MPAAGASSTGSRRPDSSFPIPLDQHRERRHPSRMRPSERRRWRPGRPAPMTRNSARSAAKAPDTRFRSALEKLLKLGRRLHDSLLRIHVVHPGSSASSWRESRSIRSSPPLATPHGTARRPERFAPTARHLIEHLCPSLHRGIRLQKLALARGIGGRRDEESERPDRAHQMVRPQQELRQAARLGHVVAVGDHERHAAAIASPDRT